MNNLLIIAIALACLGLLILAQVYALARQGKVLRWFPLVVLVDSMFAAGTNSAFGIRMKRGIANFGPVLCQERAEWGYRWKQLLFYDRRELNAFGCAVEAVVAVQEQGVNLEKRIEAEARGLHRNYPIFKGWDEGEVLHLVTRMIPKARRWVATHSGFVRWAMQVTV